MGWVEPRPEGDRGHRLGVRGQSPAHPAPVPTPPSFLHFRFRPETLARPPPTNPVALWPSFSLDTNGLPSATSPPSVQPIRVYAPLRPPAPPTPRLRKAELGRGGRMETANRRREAGSRPGTGGGALQRPCDCGRRRPRAQFGNCFPWRALGPLRAD